MAIYHQGGRTFSDIAREYDISPTSVAAWVRENDVDSGAAEASTRDDKRTIAELRRELARKEEELEILGKAVAFFVRKQDRYRSMRSLPRRGRGQSNGGGHGRS